MIAYRAPAYAWAACQAAVKVGDWKVSQDANWRLVLHGVVVTCAGADLQPRHHEPRGAMLDVPRSSKVPGTLVPN
jgi:hypothetical protein